MANDLSNAMVLSITAVPGSFALRSTNTARLHVVSLPRRNARMITSDAGMPTRRNLNARPVLLVRLGLVASFVGLGVTVVVSDSSAGSGSSCPMVVVGSVIHVASGTVVACGDGWGASANALGAGALGARETAL